MQDGITWSQVGVLIALLLGLGGVVKWVLSAMARRDQQLSAMQAAMNLQVQGLRDDLAEYKVEVAQTYATTKAVEAAEVAMDKAMQGVFGRLDTMNQRLDNFLTMFAQPTQPRRSP